MDRVNIDIEYINKIYKYMKHDMNIEEFMMKFHINFNELEGILELCRIYGKNIDVVEKNGSIYFEKKFKKSIITTKPDLDNETLNHTEILVVSDTHFGNIHQQLHLLNKVYEEAYNRGIDTVLHCGDMVDGNYYNASSSFLKQIDKYYKYHNYGPPFLWIGAFIAAIIIAFILLNKEKNKLKLINDALTANYYFGDKEIENKIDTLTNTRTRVIHHSSSSSGGFGGGGGGGSRGGGGRSF